MKKEILHTGSDDVSLVADSLLAEDLYTTSQKIEAGLPVVLCDYLQKELGLSNVELSELLTIPSRTLARRRNSKSLPQDESERVYRILRLLDDTTDILGSKSEAVSWLKETNYSLNGRPPLQMAKNLPGLELVQRLLNSIKYGLTV